MSVYQKVVDALGAEYDRRPFQVPWGRGAIEAHPDTIAELLRDVYGLRNITANGSITIETNVGALSTLPNPSFPPGRVLVSQMVASVAEDQDA